MFNALLIPVAMLAAAPAAGKEDQAVLPDWMTGCWVEERSDRWTEECWMHPRGGMMLGASRSGRGDKVTETEFLRIDTNVALGEGPAARMVYSALLPGGGATPFVWSPSDQPGVTFTNQAHDYPQRIRYWREGPLLLAEISLLDGSRALRWRYTAAHR